MRDGQQWLGLTPRTSTGKPVAIDELLAERPAGLPVLARPAHAQLPTETARGKRHVVFETDRDGLAPTTENDQTYTLTPRELVIGSPVASLVCGRVRTAAVTSRVSATRRGSGVARRRR